MGHIELADCKVSYIDDLVIIKWEKHPELEDLTRITRILKSIKSKHQLGACILNIIKVPEPYPPKPAVKDGIREMSHLNHCTAHLIKSSGLAATIARSFITIASSLSKAKRSVKVFQDEEEALIWLSKHSQDASKPWSVDEIRELAQELLKD